MAHASELPCSPDGGLILNAVYLQWVSERLWDGGCLVHTDRRSNAPRSPYRGGMERTLPPATSRVPSPHSTAPE